jgi:hypothetical protein
MWLGRPDISGYGRIQIDGKHNKAHRAAFFLHYGHWPVPQANHHCGNRACVRWDHLYEGTQKRNVQDALEQGTQYTVWNTQAARNAHTKLTESQVLEIRSASGLLREIAARFDISIANVIHIQKRRSWKHLP